MSDFKLVKLLGSPIYINSKLVPTGEYDPTRTYEVCESVSFGISSYVAILQTTGNLPTNTTYWQLLAEGSNAAGLENLVGSMMTDSPTIDFTYNSTNETIKADIVANSIDDTKVNKISPVKIEDAQNKNYENSILTTNNVATNLFSLNVATDCSMLLEAKIVARRVGGTAGTPGDCATFKRSLRVKCISGLVTIHDLQSDYTSKDNHNVNVTFQVSGADVVIKAKGDTNNNIKWILNLVTSVNI